MSFKTILTQVEPDWGSGHALRAAVQTANRFSAHLVGLAAQGFDQSSYAFGDVGLIQVVREQIDLDLASAERRFRAATEGAPAGASWISETAYPADAMARHARGADLIVATREPDDSSAATLCRCADLIMQGGAPVLVAPDDPEPLAAKRIVFAWREGREARKALAEALPFLTQADQVMLVTVRPPDQRLYAETELREIAQRLSRHRVSVAVDVLATGHSSVGQKIVEAAHRFHADLIVAGAYSHMRLREWVLGGVTADLLNQRSKYVLFSH